MILVVEDDPSVLEMLRHLLEGSGYDVTTASDGLEALRLLDEGLKPDVILTDLIMPNLGGRELVERLTARYEAPVLVLSGYVDDFRHEVLDRVKGILRKPFNRVALLGLVSQWTKPDHPVEGNP